MSRDVLAPPLLRMGANRCYRVNLVHEDFGGSRARQQPTQTQSYVEEDLYADDDDDDKQSGDFKVEELTGGVFKLTMNVAPAFYGGIIGYKGASKRRIENETRVEINIPPRIAESSSNKSENVVIKGKTRSAVCAARRRIILLLQTLRERMRPTHFVAAPLASQQIKQKYLEFKREVLACNLPGIDESAFQTPDCLHQTLVTCCLLNDAERAIGVELLQSCREFLANIKTPLQINLRGLEIMNDDPSAVRVLYAVVESDDLQQLANFVTKRYKDSGFSTEKSNRDNVKLHMTLMNTRHGNDNKSAPTTFDAREILKRFGDFDFGSAQCNELQLCAMRADGESRDYYKITGNLQF